MFFSSIRSSKSYRNGRIILPQGHTGQAMGIIEAGEVEIYHKGEDGSETVYTTLGPGEMFGVDSLFSDQPRGSGIRAVGSARVSIMNRREFIRRAHHQPHMAYHALQSVCQRLQEVDDDLQIAEITDATRRRKRRTRQKTSYGKLLWEAMVGVLFRPARLFRKVSEMDLLPLAMGLQLFRWLFVSGVTMTHFYLLQAPTLFPIPFGINLQSYRFFEIFGYFFYGLLILLFISYEIWLRGRLYAQREMPFSRVWVVVALAYFAPWLPTAILDNALVAFGLAHPLIVIPLHTAVVGGEAYLTMAGLRIVFGMPKFQAWALGAWGGIIFLAFAALGVR